jgi:hypothetical protein
LAQFWHSLTFTQIVILIYFNEYNDLFIILSHTSLKNWEISEFSCKELMKKAGGGAGEQCSRRAMARLGAGGADSHQQITNDQ